LSPMACRAFWMQRNDTTASHAQNPYSGMANVWWCSNSSP
jgi:hypothetical protein